MKTKITIALLFMSLLGFSQHKMTPKQQEQMKKAMEAMKNTGSISFEINGKKENTPANLIKGKEGYTIIAGGTAKNASEAMGPNQKMLLLYFDQLTSGTQQFQPKEPRASGITMNGKLYEIRGSITLKVSGKKASGTFKGELIDVIKRESFKKVADRVDANAKAGHISGTFSNLTLTDFKIK